MNDVRLIDANAFEEKLKNFVGDTAIGRMLIYTLMNEPTVAAPVVHGWWYVSKYKTGTCSNCRRVEVYLYNYCPHCGAKMDLKED